MVVRQGGQLVAIGSALGIPLALGVTRLVSSQPVGVSSHDFLIYLAVAGILPLRAWPPPLSRHGGRRW